MRCMTTVTKITKPFKFTQRLNNPFRKNGTYLSSCIQNREVQNVVDYQRVFLSFLQSLNIKATVPTIPREGQCNFIPH